MQSLRAAPRVDVLGVHISAVDMAQAIETITGWIERDERHYVCVSGVHGVMESQADPELRSIHNRSGLTVPDGMPMVWMGRWAGATWMRRVAGPDLMLELSRQAARRSWRCFFYGGAPGIPEELANRLTSMFPGLTVAGTLSPPFRALHREEISQIAASINRTSPDLVWVGLSTPKQERWMAEFRPLLGAPVLLGVGAAFDLHAGRSTRAPEWMQSTGLEWVYRLWKEPRRLWRRYLANNPRFVLGALRRPPRLLTGDRFPPDRGRMVVLVGPDGAGKTTVASALLARHTGRYYHFRPPFRANQMSPLPPQHAPPGRKHPGKSPAPLGWLRLARNLAITWIGHMTAVRPTLRRGELVVGDRSMYGYVAQPGPLKYSGPDWLARMAIRVLPRPDLVVALLAPAEILAQRKAELTEAELDQEMRRWRTLSVPNSTFLDASRPTEELVAEIEGMLGLTTDRRAGVRSTGTVDGGIRG